MEGKKVEGEERRGRWGKKWQKGKDKGQRDVWNKSWGEKEKKQKQGSAYKFDSLYILLDPLCWHQWWLVADLHPRLWEQGPDTLGGGSVDGSPGWHSPQHSHLWKSNTLSFVSLTLRGKEEIALAFFVKELCIKNVESIKKYLLYILFTE